MRTSGPSRATSPGLITGGIIGGVLALAAAACGSSAPSAAPAASASASHHAMASHHPMAESAVFGSDCGMVPANGMGSLHSMAMDPAATAVSTIFAPANTAFAKLPASAMTMMHSTAELTKILKYHVVSGHITPAELASGKPLTTLEGSTLKPSKMGAVYEVNSADVICGNIHTANATVYVINKVLIPMH